MNSEIYIAKNKIYIKNKKEKIKFYKFRRITAGICWVHGNEVGEKRAVYDYTPDIKQVQMLKR